MVVIVSLLIAVISGSVLTIAYFYKAEMQKKMRLEKLTANLESGITILLSPNHKASDQKQLVDLFKEQKDSVLLAQIQWGVFELNTVKAFELKDSIKKSFFSGTSFEDPAAIYLADEDRPLSVSGKTKITGDGELPKAGLKQAYVDGRAYEGKELIKGKIKSSSRSLPNLNDEMVQAIVKHFNQKDETSLPMLDSVQNSFFNETRSYKIKTGQQNLGQMKLIGKIILFSDTIITINASTYLEDIQVYAPAILIEDGFTGSCQLFARDSIVIGKNCDFRYPSFAGVFKSDTSKIQTKLKIGEGSSFSGILLCYEKKRSELQTLISLGKDCKIQGQVYANGYLKLDKQVAIKGKVYATRFIMQTPATLYENYLIDVELNRTALSKYYLSSGLFNAAKSENHILKWLN